MSMNGGSLSSAIKASTKALFLGFFGVYRNELTASEQSQYDQAVDDIAHAIGFGDGSDTVSHIQTNADITLLAADIPVNPGSFEANGFPVVGQGENAAVTLTQKID